MRRASACRATPRPSKAGSTRTGTRSSGTSTSRSETIRAAGDPVVSVDTKKKELVGAVQATAAGSGARKASRPGSAPTTSPTRTWARRSPTGSTTWPRTPAWVNVGTDHDTAAFAVESLRRWWHGAGRGRLPAGPAAADHRRRGRLQRLPHPRVEGRAGRARAAEAGLEITVLPLPARHLQVEQDRAPAVLPHHHELARPAADQPRSHHQHHRRDHHPHRATRARPNSTPAVYPTGAQVSDKQMAALPLNRHDWHGDWNYTLRPAGTRPAASIRP